MASNTNGGEKKDHWSAQKYSAAAGFVPRLTQKVLQYLDPQPTDRILDVGCGDGKFTASFASTVAEVYGVDASPSFISAAVADHGRPMVSFKVVDCRFLELESKAVNGKWDKVVSNAALHWILADASTRIATLTACYAALRPGGTFVFEMGGAGNVGEVHAALLGALMHTGGLSLANARAADPWFYPSESWMRAALNKIGFEILVLELEYRPTRLMEKMEGGGLEGWVRLMGGQMLDAIPDQGKREAVVKNVCEVLESVVTRIEDGSQWLGYVRLRGVARRPK